MAFAASHARLIGSLVAGVVGALSFVYPAHAAEFAGISATLLAALHVKRPGDTAP